MAPASSTSPGSATDGKCLHIAITNGAFKDWPMQPSGIIATGGMWSTLDPATSRILWQAAEPTGSWAFGSGPGAKDMVYAGSMDPQRYVRALAAATAIAHGMVLMRSHFRRTRENTNRV